MTKNDHSMLLKAKERGFCPEYVLFDSWYASLDNLKLIKKLGWLWLTRLTPTRLVDPDGEGNRPLNEVNVKEEGTLVHLKAYGWIKVFNSKDRGIEYLSNKQP